MSTLHQLLCFAVVAAVVAQVSCASDSLLTKTQNVEKAGNFFCVYNTYATSTVLTIIIILAT